MIIIRALLLLLVAGYAIYTDQLEMAMSVVCAYIAGLCFIRAILKPTTTIPFHLYEFFFLVYGSLVLFSHIELIHDPFVDYFVHIDASQSFYEGIMNGPIYAAWSNIAAETLYNPFFDDYPLAAFLFTVLAKVALWLGIVNVRLFLRIHIFLIAALIIAIMARLLECYGFRRKYIVSHIVPFGLFSYLYITSAIFNRDIHVCIIYTMVGFCFLSPVCRYRIVKLLGLLLLAYGFRPENAAPVLLMIAGYYWLSIHKRIGLLANVAIVFAGICAVWLLDNMISMLLDTVARYDEKSLANTGGFFIVIYSLPFPINTVAMSVYMLLQPLPMTSYIIKVGGSWLTLPFTVSPYLMSLCVCAVCWYLVKLPKVNLQISIFLSLSLLTFVAIVYASPDLRRAFAIIPCLYMAYGLVRPRIPESIIHKIKYLSWPILALINIFFLVYTL